MTGVAVTLAKDGSLAQLHRAGAGTACVTAGAVPLLSLVVGRADGSEGRQAIPGEVELTAEGMRISDFRVEGAPIAVAATVELRTAGTEVLLDVRLEVGDPELLVLEAAVSVGPLTLDPEGSGTAYLPNHGGERLVDVRRSLAQIGSSSDRGRHGRPRVRAHQGSWRYEIGYAGGASMPWLHVEGPDDALYLGSHDPSFRTTWLRLDAAPEGLVASLAWPVGAVSEWRSPTIVLAVAEPGWHGSAERYRAWFDSVVPAFRHDSEWWERVAYWLPFLKTADGRVRYRFADLPALAEKWRTYGFDTLAPYGWSEGGFDSVNPAFFPDIELGGPSEMRRAYGAVRDAGGHLMGYLNARIFSRRSLHADTLGRQWAVQLAGEQDHVETYGIESFVVVCPEVVAWRDLLAGFGDELARTGVDLVYYDQVASAAPIPCYSPHHGHVAGGAGWNTAYRHLLADAADRLAASAPDAALSIEGCADLFAPYALVQSSVGMLMSGTDHNFPELFKYAFPEVLQADLVYFTAEDPDALYSAQIPLLPRDVARYWLCRAITVGSCFGVLEQSIDDTPWWDEAVELLRLRRAAGTLMQRMRFRHDRDVVSSSPGVEACTFRGERTMLVTVHDTRPGTDRSVAVAHGLRRPRVLRLLPDGAREPIGLAAGDVAEIAVPATPLSMFVLEEAP